MGNVRLVALMLAISLLGATLACTGEDSTPGTLTPVPQERSISAEQGVSPQASPEDVPSGSDESSTTAPAPIQPQSGPGIDLTDAQHEDIDAQISELRKTPAVLAECARENGDSVPTPGSAGEIEWYARAAIQYATCASGKTTGINWGGN